MSEVQRSFVLFVLGASGSFLGAAGWAVVGEWRGVVLCAVLLVCHLLAYVTPRRDA